LLKSVVDVSKLVVAGMGGVKLTRQQVNITAEASKFLIDELQVLSEVLRAASFNIFLTE
jgi:hypothetical protein